MTGKTLYWNLIRQAKRAQRHGEIKGLLWYQGEADAGPSYEDVELYRARLMQLFRSVRRDLGAPEQRADLLGRKRLNVPFGVVVACVAIISFWRAITG